MSPEKIDSDQAPVRQSGEPVEEEEKMPKGASVLEEQPAAAKSMGRAGMTAYEKDLEAELKETPSYTGQRAETVYVGPASSGPPSPRLMQKGAVPRRERLRRERQEQQKALRTNQRSK